MSRIVVVHGVRNLQRALSPQEASQKLAAGWQKRLVAGYQSAGLRHMSVPQVTAAYYAHHVTDAEAQGSDGELDSLPHAEQLAVLSWLRTVGFPTEPDEGQSWGGLPLRQTIDLVARRRGIAAQTLARIAVALMPEVYRYLSSPARRAASRQEVVRAVQASGANVVVAHSLGSVVAYEALCAAKNLGVTTFITLGSPLGLPSAVFDALEPAPVNGRGQLPQGVVHWTNVADVGDLVALPRRLGHRFPVTTHEELNMAVVDFHTLGMYLGSGITAAAVAPHC